MNKKDKIKHVINKAAHGTAVPSVQPVLNVIRVLDVARITFFYFTRWNLGCYIMEIAVLKWCVGFERDF